MILSPTSYTHEHFFASQLLYSSHSVSSSIPNLLPPLSLFMRSFLCPEVYKVLHLLPVIFIRSSSMVFSCHSVFQCYPFILPLLLSCFIFLPGHIVYISCIYLSYFFPYSRIKAIGGQKFCLLLLLFCFPNSVRNTWFLKNTGSWMPSLVTESASLP